MSYNSEYFSKYQKYLDEDVVRNQHDMIFDMFQTFAQPERVLDLGCGGCCEYELYGNYVEYIGVEIEKSIVDQLKEIDIKIFNLNYRDENFLNEIYSKHDLLADTFISLFSSELTAHHSDNIKLYEKLFSSGFQHGLVSGIYYKNKKDINPVLEVGDIYSWQTLGSVENYDSNVYSTVLIQLPVPSKMFGDDVIEVWKMMRKK